MEKRKNLQNKVYSFLQKIPKGKVVTYKQLAIEIGLPKAYRAVGTTLGKNEEPVKIPCYKVVKSDGNIGRYNLGAKKKEEFLKRDGVEIKNGRVVNLHKYLFKG